MEGGCQGKLGRVCGGEWQGGRVSGGGREGR